MRLDPTQVAEIKASQFVYSTRAVAKAYEVAPSTVCRIWNERIHTGIQAAEEAPNIQVKPRPVDLREDIDLLLGRGMSAEEVAKALGISTRSVWQHKGVFI